ncbi:DsbA family protein [Aestuariispira ectoiniformans]|uniref:DsbA family protein n=1 Tax=Aestuariispira ectoiniformans TaxID=2775080 RepID=UPI00223AADC6|nr:DsbA family protein [Aestuariispira ectoiniformans]
MRRILSLIVVGLTFWAVTANAAEVNLDEAIQERVLGDPNAPVTMIEFSSLTCPHCADFHKDKLPEIKKKYIDTGKVKLVYRDFPWDQAAAAAALLARCSPPDRYFKFLDALFRNREKWISENPIEGLTRLGKMGGVSEDKFKACLSEGKIMDDIIKSRMEGAQKYEVSATPTFIIKGADGEEKIEGDVDLEEFESTIDKFLP